MCQKCSTSKQQDLAEAGHVWNHIKTWINNTIKENKNWDGKLGSGNPGQVTSVTQRAYLKGTKTITEPDNPFEP